MCRKALPPAVEKHRGPGAGPRIFIWKSFPPNHAESPRDPELVTDLSQLALVFAVLSPYINVNFDKSIEPSIESIEALLARRERDDAHSIPAIFFSSLLG